MKKLFVMLLTSFMLVSFIAPVSATEHERKIISKEVEVFEDGSYFECIIYEDVYANTRSIPTTKTGSKVGTFTNANGEALWSVTVTGTFLYDGYTVTCTSSSVSTAVYSSAWKIYSQSSNKTSNTAMATAVAKRYYLGTVVETKEKTVSLTCSRTGTLS